VVGSLAAIVTYRIDPLLTAWMSPVLGGLVLSIPLSYLTGSLPIGNWFQRRGLFATPVESRPAPEVVAINAALARTPTTEIPDVLRGDYGLLQATLDPYVNAVHLSLLRAKEEVPPETEVRFAVLRQKLLREGPAKLSARDKLALLMDADAMDALHEEIWSTPGDRLAPWWQQALRHYSLVAPAPETPFVRAA
jgi:membrane glycosyltransferase